MKNKNCCINFGAAVFFMYSQPKQEQGGGEQKLFPIHHAVIVHQQEPHDEQGDHSIHIQPDTLQTRISVRPRPEKVLLCGGSLVSGAVCSAAAR